MERDVALEKLRLLVGQELHELALQYDVTVQTGTGAVNKGWAGHVIERYLGLQINSAQAPNFGSWELKVVPIKQNKNGSLVFKETMAVTMIDARHVREFPFQESHLLHKLRRALIVGRMVGKSVSESQFIHSVTLVGLDENSSLYVDVENDYNTVRDCIIDPRRGFNSLTGKMGIYVQPRTKGQGHGSTSRAFYARKEFLMRVINLDKDSIVNPEALR